MQKKKQKMHVRFQNSCKKRAEMQKKAQNAFQFENSCQKRAKMEKKKAHLFGFFRFYIPCAFFCILNLNFQKKMQKKAKMQKKKMQKKAYGVYLMLIGRAFVNLNLIFRRNNSRRMCAV